MVEEDIDYYASFESPELAIGSMIDDHMLIKLICQYNMFNKYHCAQVLIYSGDNLDNIKLEKRSKISLTEPIYVFTDSKVKIDILTDQEIDKMIELLSKNAGQFGTNFDYLVHELNYQYELNKELFWKKKDITMPDYNKLKGENAECLSLKSLLRLIKSSKKEKLKNLY